MKGEAKVVYEDIRQDLIRLHANWLIYKQLFTMSEERFVVLNDTAPGFFRLIQDVLVDDAVISLGRLTDPAHYQSIARLVKELKGQVRNTFFQELDQDYRALQLICDDIREHRHKRVAHRTRKGASPEVKDIPTRLPPLTRKKIEGAMAAMAQFMNKVLSYFESVEQFYEPVMAGDANTLIYFLEKGLEATRRPQQFRSATSSDSKSA